MINIPTDKITEKIMLQCSYPKKVASGIAGRLLKVDEKLHKSVEDWYYDKKSEFEYEDINFDYIQKKLGVSLSEAILIMNTMLHDSEYAKRFKNRRIEFK